MGRPPLAVGTLGDITTTEVAPKQWKARAYIRDADGRRREITRFAATQAAARAAVKNAAKERADVADAGDVTAETKLDDVAKWWLERIDRSGKAVTTKRVYNSAIGANILPALGGMRLRELTVPRIDKALTAIADHKGPGAAQTARSVLSGMIGDAVRVGAIPSNPVRDTSPISDAEDEGPRAFTIDEQFRVMDYPRTDRRCIDLDLPDFIDWMLGTGMRIGEVCAIRDSVLDLQAGTVEVNATVVRVTGRGLVIQERTKSDAGWRVLAIPSDILEMLRRRKTELRAAGPDVVTFLEKDGKTYRTETGVGVVFTSPRGKLRDPSNTQADLRRFFDGLDCEECNGTGRVQDETGKWVRCEAGPFAWATSHVFRKTVATRLDEAGFPPRVVADILGHKKPSMTQDKYFGRRVVSAAAADALVRPERPAIPA